MIFSCSLLNSCATVYAVSGTNPDDFPIIDKDKDNDDKTFEEQWYKMSKNIDDFVAYVFTQSVSLFSGNYEQYTRNRDFIRSQAIREDGTINEEIVSYDEATDSITMDISSFLQEVSSQMGLIIVPENMSKSDDPYDKAFSSSYGDDNRRNFLHYYNNGSKKYVYLVDTDSCYLVRERKSVSSDYIYLYSKETLEKMNGGVTRFDYNFYGNPLIKENNTYYLPSYDNIYMFNYLESSQFTTYKNNTKVYKPFSYWVNIDYLQRFLNSDTYIGSSFGQNSTVTVPVSELDRDWTKVLQDVLLEIATIKLATGSHPTQKQVDEAVEKIVGALENIGGNVSGNNPGGNNPGGNIGGDIGDIKDILEKLDISKLEEALEMIKKAIAEAGDTNHEDLAGMKELMADMERILAAIQNGITSQSDYNKILSDIYGLLEKMYKVQKLDLALDVADLVTDFVDIVDGGDTSVLDRVSTSLANVANVSQEHFPTSIPWDLIAIFTLFCAEPVAPSYDVPFSIPALGIHETISIDLTEFEMLSKISRSLLSVLFILLLIHLTRKSTAPDEGDG